MKQDLQLPEIYPDGVSLRRFHDELSLVRGRGARIGRELTKEKFHELFDPSRPTLGFGPGSICGQSLIAVAAQENRERSLPSINVILIGSPITDLYVDNSEDGMGRLYATRGGLVTKSGTIYFGTFPYPVELRLFDDYQVSTGYLENDIGLPLLNSTDSFEIFDYKSSSKSHLRPLAIENKIYLPEAILLHAGDDRIDQNVEAFLELMGVNGVVVKPDNGSCGNDVYLFDKPVLKSVLCSVKTCMFNSGLRVLVEERIPSLRFTRGEELYDWNLRVLGTPEGVLDIEVRYSLNGAPVNISKGARAREFTPRFLMELGIAREEAKELHSEALKHIDKFIKASVREFGSGFVGVDIIITDKLQSELEYLVLDKYVIACNEVNVGAVGGLTTLANIRRNRSTKLKAPKKFIDWASRLPSSRSHPEKLVQLSKFGEPEQYLEKAWNQETENYSDVELMNLFSLTIRHFKDLKPMTLMIAIDFVYDRGLLSKTHGKEILDKFPDSETAKVASAYILYCLNQTRKAEAILSKIVKPPSDPILIEAITIIDPKKATEVILEIEKEYPEKISATVLYWRRLFYHIGDPEFSVELAVKMFDHKLEQLGIEKDSTPDRSAEPGIKTFFTALLTASQQGLPGVECSHDLEDRIAIVSFILGQIGKLKFVQSGYADQFVIPLRASLLLAHVALGESAKAQELLKSWGETDWKKCEDTLKLKFGPDVLEELESLHKHTPLPFNPPINEFREAFLERSHWGKLFKS